MLRDLSGWDAGAVGRLGVDEPDHSRIRHFFKAGWSIAMAVHTGESI